MNESTKLRIIMTREDLENEKSEVSEAAGVKFGPPEPVDLAKDNHLTDARFVELVGVVAIGALSSLVLRLVNNWIQKRENGTLIDLRKDPVEISLVRNIPQGTMVIIDQNGKSQVHKADNIPDPYSFVSNLLSKGIPS